LENGNRGLPSPEILMKLAEGLHSSYPALMQMAGYLETDPATEPKQREPLNLRRLIRENSLILDGTVLTDDDKEWIERMLTALFWKERKKRGEST
jgi:transcriptional regulator with XRE-family HTH domain